MEVKSLNELKGRIKYIYVSAVFHLFDEKTQQAAAERIANLLRIPAGSIGDAPIAGCVLFGRQQTASSPMVIDDKAWGGYVLVYWRPMTRQELTT